MALSVLALAADSSAKVAIPTDGNGAPMGFAFVEFRTAAAADNAMRLLHNNLLDQRPLFLRPDVDASASDEIELAAKREKLASKMQQMQQVTFAGSWIIVIVAVGVASGGAVADVQGVQQMDSAPPHAGPSSLLQLTAYSSRHLLCVQLTLTAHCAGPLLLA